MARLKQICNVNLRRSYLSQEYCSEEHLDPSSCCYIPIFVYALSSGAAASPNALVSLMCGRNCANSRAMSLKVVHSILRSNVIEERKKFGVVFAFLSKLMPLK
jgi:hypothetical protein